MSDFSLSRFLRKLTVHLATAVLRWQYRRRPYSEYYAAAMQVRTAYDPKFAVGGRWDEIGRLQFDFLRSQGLQPSHRLLDFGCGSLRGGLHFIEYLDEGGYYGVDISAQALEAGRAFLRERGLEGKRSTLRLTHDLSFADYEGRTFDFIIAQSVLTHMPLEDIETLFANVHKLLHPDSIFFATYFDGGSRTYTTQNRLNFYFPFETLREAGARRGLAVSRAGGYRHPRGQKMLGIRLS